MLEITRKIQASSIFHFSTSIHGKSAILLIKRIATARGHFHPTAFLSRATSSGSRKFPHYGRIESEFHRPLRAAVTSVSHLLGTQYSQLDITPVNGCHAGSHIGLLALVQLEQIVEMDAPRLRHSPVSGTSATEHDQLHQLFKRAMESGLLIICQRLGKITLFASASRTKTTRAFAKQHGMRNLGCANDVHTHLLKDFSHAAKVSADECKLFFLCINGIAAINTLAHII